VTVTIDLSPEEEAALRTKAQSQGVSVDQFLRSVLQQVTAESRNKTAGSGSLLAQPSQFSAFEAGMPFVFSKDTSKVSTTF